jgi:hypothetical protein
MAERFCSNDESDVRRSAIAFVATFALAPLPAFAVEPVVPPTWDSIQRCDEIIRDTYKSESIDTRNQQKAECVTREKGERAYLLKDWKTFTPASREMCVQVYGKYQLYSMLATCLDVQNERRDFASAPG